MDIQFNLVVVNSKQDRIGNCYWAFRFYDYATGKEVCATGGGCESNIKGIQRCWNNGDDWDRTINIVNLELGIKDFNKMTKGWEYAGCLPEEMATFIRTKLRE